MARRKNRSVVARDESAEDICYGISENSGPVYEVFDDRVEVLQAAYTHCLARCRNDDSARKRKYLEAAGRKVGSATEFLGLSTY